MNILDTKTHSGKVYSIQNQETIGTPKQVNKKSRIKLKYQNLEHVQSHQPNKDKQSQDTKINSIKTHPRHSQSQSALLKLPVKKQETILKYQIPESVQSSQQSSEDPSPVTKTNTKKVVPPRLQLKSETPKQVTKMKHI